MWLCCDKDFHDKDFCDSKKQTLNLSEPGSGIYKNPDPNHRIKMCIQIVLAQYVMSRVQGAFPIFTAPILKTTLQGRLCGAETEVA